MTSSSASQPRAHPVNHALGRLDVARVLPLDERFHHERLEQLERHLLGQPHSCSFKSGPTTMTGPARVVHALAQQVLAEAAFLALEHVRQRLERRPFEPVTGRVRRPLSIKASTAS
jgi:hypothetical protein